MPVLGNGSRDRIDRIAAAVGGAAFLAGIVAMTIGATAPAPAAPPAAASTTVVSSPMPGSATTQTVTTTNPPTRPTLEPRIVQETTVTEGGAQGSVTVTTSPVVAVADQQFLGSTVAVIVVQLLLITLTALFLAFATQRILLGEYGLRRAAAGVRGTPIDEGEAKAVKQDVVSAHEAPDLSRPLFEKAGVTDARLRLLQSRIALELEVRKLAQDHDVPASLSIPSVVRGLVEKKKMSPKLASAITSLNELGDRLGSGAEITPDAVTLLTESYAQALAKIGGKLKR